MDSFVVKELHKILSHVLTSDPLDVVFSGLFIPMPGEESPEDKALRDLKSLWSQVSQEQHEELLSGLLSFANEQTNHQRFVFCFNLLSSLADCGLVPYKLLFDTLIDHLDFNSSEMWMESFSVMSNHIQNIDYKVCRELLILVLIKLCNCPLAIPVEKLCLIKVTKEFISKLLDRNTGLLPGYIAYSAIAKHFPEGSTTHWVFEDMWQKFSNTFIPLSDLISIKGRSELSPVVGVSSSAGHVWKLDSSNLKFRRNHVLPFSEEQNQPQSKLLKAVVSQPCSKDMVSMMLSLSRQHRQRCLPLEEALVDLLLTAMNKLETSDETTTENKIFWEHLSSQLVFFVLYQFARFAGLVRLLHDKLCAQTRQMTRSREKLMWVLLQLFSPAIQSLQLSDLAPLFAIFKRLYPEQEAARLPEIGMPYTATAMAASAVWMHMSIMLSKENAGSSRQPPPYIRNHLEYLSQDKQTLLAHAREPLQIASLCNAFISVPDTFTQLMASLVERWSGGASPPTNKVPMPGTGNLMAVGITEPCPLELLNSLTTYAKMSLWNNVLSRVLKPSAGHGHLCLSPALVETYSRLIVYMEMDYGLALKTFLGQAFPSVWRQNNKPTAHTFLELLTYRLQRHIQPHYRLQLLGILYQLSGGGFGSNYQLQLSIESTALRLLVGLGSSDLLTQMAKVTGDARLQNIGQLLSPDSEELNRLFVLVLARSIRIGCLDNPSGGWVENTVRQTYNTTPHSWPQHVLNCMPESVRACYRDYPTTNSISRPEDKQTLLNTVDEEWRKWTSMASGPSQDVVSYFTQEGGPPIYLCLLLKMLLDQGKIPPLAYGVLETLSAKAFSTQIHTLIDYVVAFILAMRNDPNHQRMFINRAVAALNELVWKYNVIPHDRLVLCMALRHYDSGDLSVLLVIIHVLLTRTREFKDRVTAFLAENSPEYWLQSDWHQKHITFHQNYPELIYFEGVQDRAAHSQKTYLPIYYGNVCLRFLPVFDIFTHRLIELLPQTVRSLEQLLDAFGGLYKFHDRPITHLYHTLHYYYNILADKTAVKKKLVGAVLGKGKDASERPSGWCLSQSYLDYLTSDSTSQWIPDLTYFNGLVHRLVEMIKGHVPQQFSRGDWRFLELPTPALHMLYSASVELLSLPDFPGAAVGRSLLELVSSSANLFSMTVSMSLINATSLLLTALPESYWRVLNEQYITILRDLVAADYPTSIHSQDSDVPYNAPYSLEDLLSPPAKKQGLSDESGCVTANGFDHLFGKMFGEAASRILVLSTSFWHHSSIGQLMSLVNFVKETVQPFVQTEKQLLYVFHLVAPMLARFHLERASCILDVVLALYNMLRTVDTAGGVSQQVDLVCDFFYHIKYSLIGDAGKDEISEIIASLRADSVLYSRLRFMVGPPKQQDVAVSETV